VVLADRFTETQLCAVRAVATGPGRRGTSYWDVLAAACEKAIGVHCG